MIGVWTAQNAKDVDAQRAIQNVPPGRVVRAADADAVAAAVREATAADSAAGGAVVDYGRYHAGLGHAPPPGYVRIEQTGGVIKHDQADMAVRVRAATTLEALQHELREAKQWLPIDAPGDMTIGEVMAHHVYGPWRCGFGSVRDLLLGLGYVSAAGETITVGGRTVKNVAGYDVTRLMVGSLNTLGVLTEATLRTFALPEVMRRFVIGPVCPTVIDARLTSLLTSDAAPAGAAFTWSSEQPAEPALQVAYAGPTERVAIEQAALMAWLQAELPDVPCAEAAGAIESDWRWTMPAAVKVVVPPGRCGEVQAALRELPTLPTLRGLGLFTHGVIWLGFDCDTATARTADRLITRIAELHGGYREWLHRPNDDGAIAPVWPRPSDWAVQRRVKAALDPNDLFNPGRVFEA